MSNKDKYQKDIDDLNLLDKNSPDIDMASLSKLDEMEEIKELFDFNDLYSNSEREASDYIDSLLKHYIDDDYMNSDYIKKRVEIDKLNLANCIYQMKSSKVALTKILELIDSGVSASPPMFKSLTDLEKSNLEILKYFKTYIQIMEKEYESIASSSQLNKPEEAKQIQSGDGKVLVKSQKDMIEKLRKHKEDENE